MSTKIKTPEGWKNVAGGAITAEYVKDQNILSDYETPAIGASAATATTIKYDGFIIVDKGNTNPASIYVNGIYITSVNNVPGTSTSATVPVRKGDVVYITNQESADIIKACWYKLRDYTGR